MRVRWKRRDDWRGGGCGPNKVPEVACTKSAIYNNQVNAMERRPKENEKNNSREYKRRTRDAGAPPKEQLESHPPSMWKKELSLLLYSSIQSEEIWVKTHKAHSE